MSRFSRTSFRSRRGLTGATVVVALGAAAAATAPSLAGGSGVAAAQTAFVQPGGVHVHADPNAAHNPDALAALRVPQPPVAKPAPSVQSTTAKPAPTGLTNGAERASRSSTRTSLTPTTGSPSGSPKAIAQAMLAGRGWSGQFSCLNRLWTKESGWKVSAANPSGAYGIPQALPGSKMASAGPNWQSDPATQIRWGLDYIASTYGSPCAAWSHSQADNWY